MKGPAAALVEVVLGATVVVVVDVVEAAVVVVEAVNGGSVSARGTVVGFLAALPQAVMARPASRTARVTR